MSEPRLPTPEQLENLRLALEAFAAHFRAAAESLARFLQGVDWQAVADALADDIDPEPDAPHVVEG